MRIKIGKGIFPCVGFSMCAQYTFTRHAVDWIMLIVFYHFLVLAPAPISVFILPVRTSKCRKFLYRARNRKWKEDETKGAYNRQKKSGAKKILSPIKFSIWWVCVCALLMLLYKTHKTCWYIIFIRQSVRHITIYIRNGTTTCEWKKRTKTKEKAATTAIPQMNGRKWKKAYKIHVFHVPTARAC